MILQGTLLFLFGTAVVSGMVLRPEIKPQPIIVTPDKYISSLGYWPSNTYYQNDLPSSVVGFSSGWKSSVLNEALRNQLHLKLKVPCLKKQSISPEIKPVILPLAPQSLPEHISANELKIDDHNKIEQFVKPVEIPEGPVLSPFLMPDWSAIQIKAVTPPNLDIENDIIVNIPKIPDVSQSLPERPEESTVFAQVFDEDVKEEYMKPADIPKAPKLPPFTMPVLPITVGFEKLHHKPCKSKKGRIEELPNIKNKDEFVELLEIPKSPELPPFLMPIVPATVPKLPEISPPPLVEWVPANIGGPQFKEELKELPFTLPVSIEDNIKPDFATEEEYIKPVEIPKAPELPPFVVPLIPGPESEPWEGHKAPETSNDDLYIHIPEIPKTPELFISSLPKWAPANVESYPTPEPEFKEESFKPINIPVALELPSFSIPELPVDIKVQPKAPKSPFLCITESKAEPEYKADSEFTKPAEIPRAPELPPFVMPSIPEPETKGLVFVSSLPEWATADVKSYHESEPEFKEESLKPINIPAAPELPPFSMPKLSLNIVEIQPKSPESALPSIPGLLAEPEFKIDEEFLKPAEIPRAPELPTFVMPLIPEPESEPCQEPKSPKTLSVELYNTKIPETPKVPELFVSSLPKWAPSNYESYDVPEPEFKEESLRSINIPAAPELPPFSMPKSLINVEVQPKAPELPLPSISESIANPESKIDEEFIQAVKIPKAPELPPFAIDEIPINAEAPKASPEYEPCDFSNGLDSPVKELFVNHIGIPVAPELPEIPKIIIEESCEEDESSGKL